jgi:hypothetical protein
MSKVRSSLVASVTVLMLSAVSACSSTNSTSPASCNAVCEVLNGASASAATTYWATTVNDGGSTQDQSLDFEIYQNGTGKMRAYTVGCSSGYGTATDFTWSSTGASTIVFTGAPCGFTSLLVGGGGVGSGTFTGTLYVQSAAWTFVSTAIVAGSF